MNESINQLKHLYSVFVAGIAGESEAVNVFGCSFLGTWLR